MGWLVVTARENDDSMVGFVLFTEVTLKSTLGSSSLNTLGV